MQEAQNTFHFFWDKFLELNTKEHFLYNTTFQLINFLYDVNIFQIDIFSSIRCRRWTLVYLKAGLDEMAALSLSLEMVDYQG